MQPAKRSQSTPNSLDEPLADTLKLILQHTSTWHPEDLCRLLQVSSSCRQALQQSRGKCLVMLRFDTVGLKARSKVQGFAEWLCNYAGLVSSFAWVQAPMCRSSEKRQELQLLQRQLALALQLCRYKAAPAAKAGPTGDAHAKTQPLPLQLTVAEFDYSWPEPQLLRELASAGLQELDLTVDPEEPAHLPPSYYSCFASLNLQRLTVHDNTHSMVHSARFMSAVQQFSALTSLYLNIVPADAAHQLPPQLQGLTTMFAAGSSGSTTVSLSHLAALRQLTCAGADGAERLQVLLPPNVTSVALGSSRAGVAISRVAGAEALQEAYMEGLKDTGINVLLHLCSLPALERLTIDNSGFSTPEAARMAAAALGSAKALTDLRLKNVYFAGGAGLCGQLSKLPRLVDLMWSGSMPEGSSDLLRLTALTSLAGLGLGLVESLNDVVAAAVARHLTGLRQLCLSYKSISSLDLLPVVGALTGLTGLCLCGGEQFVVGAGELMLLSSLTNLRDLVVRQLNCSAADRQIPGCHAPPEGH